MRTAFFGGSFNPPHVAHQMVCLHVLETAGVDRVLGGLCIRALGHKVRHGRHFHVFESFRQVGEIDPADVSAADNPDLRLSHVPRPVRSTRSSRVF